MSSAFALSCYFMYLMFWYACRPVSSPFSYNYRIDIIVMSSACLCMLFSTVCTISPIIKYLIKRENCDTVMLWTLGINIFQEEKTIFVGSDWFLVRGGTFSNFFIKFVSTWLVSCNQTIKPKDWFLLLAQHQSFAWQTPLMSPQARSRTLDHPVFLSS